MFAFNARFHSSRVSLKRWKCQNGRKSIIILFLNIFLPLLIVETCVLHILSESRVKEWNGRLNFWPIHLARIFDRYVSSREVLSLDSFLGPAWTTSSFFQLWGPLSPIRHILPSNNYSRHRFLHPFPTNI